jgi:hypothetical protein
VRAQLIALSTLLVTISKFNYFVTSHAESLKLPHIPSYPNLKIKRIPLEHPVDFHITGIKIPRMHRTPLLAFSLVSEPLFLQ